MVDQFKTEMHEAPEDQNKYVADVVAQIIHYGEGDATKAMSLAIAIITQVFLAHGGNINMGESIGEAVKQGIITTLDVYKDMARTTHRQDRHKRSLN